MGPSGLLDFYVCYLVDTCASLLIMCLSVDSVLALWIHKYKYKSKNTPNGVVDSVSTVHHHAGNLVNLHVQLSTAISATLSTSLSTTYLLKAEKLAESTFQAKKIGGKSA